jgi:hypothetical protein
MDAPNSMSPAGETAIAIELTNHTGGQQRLGSEFGSASPLNRGKEELDKIAELAILEGATVRFAVKYPPEPSPEPHYAPKRYHSPLIGWGIFDILTIGLSVPAATAVIALLRPALQEFLKGRNARSIKVKIGDVSIELKGDSDVETALRLIESLQSKDGRTDKRELLTQADQETKATAKKAPKEPAGSKQPQGSKRGKT